MTFPTIPTVAGSRILFTLNTAGGATKTFPNLSSLTKNSGDLLIAICVEYDGNSTNAEFSSWGGGFTEFGDFAGTTTMAIGCAYKWSTGSETGTFTVTTADTSANDSVMILLSIPGAHASTPPVAGGFVTGTSAAADPVSLDPAGWDVEDTLWIAVGASGEVNTTGSFTGITAGPGSTTGFAASGITADVAGGAEGAVAFLQSAAASVDLGTFTVDVSNARNAACVIAVRPASDPNATVTPATITATAALPYATPLTVAGAEVTAAAEEWTGSNGAAWDSGRWETSAGTGTIDIQSNEGRMVSPLTAFASSNARALTGVLTDCELLVRFRYAQIPNADLWVILRGDNNVSPLANGYMVVINQGGAGNQALYKRVSSVSTHLGDVNNLTLVANTWYWVRFRCEGTTISAKLWERGTAEPTAWGFQATSQTDIASGVPRFRPGSDGTPTACDVRLDDFRVGDLAAAGGGAIATPAVIAATSAVARPDVNVTAGPAVAASTSTVPRPNVNVAAGPAVIARAVVLPQATPTISGDVTAQPVVLAAATSMVRAAVNVAAGPFVVQSSAVVGDLGSASVTAGPEVVPAVAGLGQAIPQAGGSATATPAAIAGLAALPQATLSASSTVAPAVLSAAVTIPGLGASVAASPAVLAALVAQQRPSVLVAAAPAVVPLVVLVPAPTVSAGGNVTVIPAVVAALAALAQPGVGVGAGPAVLAALAGVGDARPAVGAGPATVPLVVALPSPSIFAGGGAAPAPATIAALAALARPAVNVAAGPAVVPLLAALGQAQAGQATAAAPAAIAAVVALGAAGASVGAGPAVIVLAVALPLVIDAGGEPVPGYGVAYVGIPAGYAYEGQPPGTVLVGQPTGEG